MRGERFVVSAKKKSREKIGAEDNIINKEGMGAVGQKKGRLCK
jgi:hypothetical protein